jgi:hypothetical protein
MAGTQVGGKKAGETNKKKYGEDFYKRIGSLGGQTETTKPKGFAAMPEWKRQAAGKAGGKKSRKNGQPV